VKPATCRRFAAFFLRVSGSGIGPSSITFVRLASIRLMLTKLFNPA
jgi:hypothetical protein